MRQEDDLEEPENIIDEEELVMLREMKDLKKRYRDLFADLKTFKQDHHDAQQQIDVLKEKLLVGFEQWYQATFEQSGQQQMLREEEPQM